MRGMSARAPQVKGLSQAMLWALRFLAFVPNADPFPFPYPVLFGVPGIPPENYHWDGLPTLGQANGAPESPCVPFLLRAVFCFLASF